MKGKVAYGLRVAAVAVALLGGAACGGGGASEEEVDVVCFSMSESARYRGMIDGVTVAHEVLTEKYGRTPAEASDLIATVVRDRCPQFRGLL